MTDGEGGGVESIMLQFALPWCITFVLVYDNFTYLSQPHPPTNQQTQPQLNFSALHFGGLESILVSYTENFAYPLLPTYTPYKPVALVKKHQFTLEYRRYIRMHNVIE